MSPSAQPDQQDVLEYSRVQTDGHTVVILAPQVLRVKMVPVEAMVNTLGYRGKVVDMVAMVDVVATVALEAMVKTPLPQVEMVAMVDTGAPVETVLTVAMAAMVFRVTMLKMVTMAYVEQMDPIYV